MIPEFIRLKSHRILHKIRSVPWRFVLLSIVIFITPAIIIFYNRSISSIMETSVYTIAFIPLFLIMLIFGYRHVRHFRHEQIHGQLSGHICPHCNYSLVGLSYGEDQLTLCPECGVAWLLPKNMITLSNSQYKRDFVASSIALMSYVVYLIWSTANGEELFSTNHAFLFCFTYGVIIMFLSQWMRNTIFISRFIQPRCRDLQGEMCPACDALIEEDTINSEGITTCPRCGAAWKLDY